MPNSPSIETDVLLKSLSADTTETGHESLDRGLAGTADWTAIIRKALDHGVAGPLCRYLLTVSLGQLPIDLHFAATRFLDDQQQLAHRAIRELFDILDALAGAGIDAIPFKGPVLSLQAYGDPTSRSFRDLDLLIRDKDIPRTMQVLADLGYRSQAAGLRARSMLAYYAYNGQDILFAEDRLPVEPHWAFAPRSLSIGFSAGDVWQRSVPLSLAGRTVRALSPEDTLVVAGLHGSKEQWTRLVWIADIAEYLRRHPCLDWDMVLKRAAEAGVLRMVLLGLTLAEQLLGAPLPEPILRRVQADRTCQILARQVAARLFGEARVDASVFQLSAFNWHVRERLSDRLRCLLATLTTARIQHFRAVDLPDSLAFAYPAVKVAHDYLALPLWLAIKTLRSGRPGSGSRLC